MWIDDLDRVHTSPNDTTGLSIRPQSTHDPESEWHGQNRRDGTALQIELAYLSHLR